MYKILTSLLLIFLTISTSHAQENNSRDYLSLGLGYYDVFDDEGAVDFRLEYRFSNDLIWGIKPLIGAEITSDASLLAGAGLYRDFLLDDQFYLTPSFALGYYAQGSSDLDLSKTLEFRSQIELGYEFEDFSRASVALSHISNGSTDESNPGTEVLSFYYHIPF